MRLTAGRPSPAPARPGISAAAARVPSPVPRAGSILRHKNQGSVKPSNCSLYITCASGPAPCPTLGSILQHRFHRLGTRSTLETLKTGGHPITESHGLQRRVLQARGPCGHQGSPLPRARRLHYLLPPA